MQIERIRRWQWCVIGAGLGALVAAVTLASGPREAWDTHNNTGGPQILEKQLLQRTDPSRRKVAGVRNVKLHPAIEMPLPGVREGNTAFASYEVLLRRDKDPVKCDVVPRVLILEQQTHAKSVVGDLKGLTLQDYLAKLKAFTDKANKEHPGAVFTFTYRSSWLETAKGAFTVYTLGGFVLIGLIWPSVLRLLVKAGYGSGATDDAFDLSTYKPGRGESAKRRPTVTQADADELARLEAELEAKLRSGEVGATAASSDDQAATGAGAGGPKKPAVPVLDAGPLEVAKDTARPAQPKGFGADQGDYYPTEVHGKPTKH
jgi:hypothetical protein